MVSPRFVTGTPAVGSVPINDQALRWKLTGVSVVSPFVVGTLQELGIPHTECEEYIQRSTLAGFSALAVAVSSKILPVAGEWRVGVWSMGSGELRSER
jgi:hypothetical protein